MLRMFRSRESTGLKDVRTLCYSASYLRTSACAKEEI